MTPADFGKLLKTNFHGCFLFYGEEQYLKRHYFSLAEKSVCQNGSNAIRVSGEGVSLRDVCQEIYEIASTPSMDTSADKRLISAVDVKWKKVDDDKKNDDESSFLEEIVNEIKTYDDVVVIFDARPEYFDAGTPKKPSKLLTRLSKIMTPVCFEKESPARLAAWTQKHFSAYKIAAQPEVCNSIVRYCGRDMTTLNNEITKLACYVLQNGKNAVTDDDVRLVSVASSEIEAFDFSNAILNNDLERAFEILTDMKLRKESPELVLSSMSRVYSDLYAVKLLLDGGLMKTDVARELKMHEYKAGLYAKAAGDLSQKGLEKAISLCYEADIKIKSSNLDSYFILDVLLIKLSNTSKIRWTK